MDEREKAAGLSGATSGYGKPTPTMSEREKAAGLGDTTSSYGKPMPTMDERERAAGLSGTTSGYGQPMPTMSEREAASGLKETTFGRRDWSQDNVNSNQSVSSGDRVETISAGPDDGIEGFQEETLDVVEDDDTAGQRTFLTKSV